ncbi:uncharacterized protein Y057_12178 [Fusarium fujikuroi]|nr:uncharacterized protein Y057_12178 [Fusarium fujikuroi]
MTTNSFGSALPRFDFPRQPAAPKLTAQAARAFPTVGSRIPHCRHCRYSCGLLLYILLCPQTGISHVYTFFDTKQLDVPEHKEYKAQGGDNAFGTDGGDRVVVDGVLNEK